MSRGDQSLEGFTRWDLFRNKIAVFIRFQYIKQDYHLVEMENYYYSYYCSYMSVLTELCSTIVLKTWNVDNVRNPLVFYNFDIRFPFGVFIPEKNCIISSKTAKV